MTFNFMSDNKDIKVETPKQPEIRQKFFNTDIKATQQLHKQARGYLKTTASLVGKDTTPQKAFLRYRILTSLLTLIKKSFLK